MKELTVEQIESIVFKPVGNYWYKLERVVFTNPLQNCAGHIIIGNEYYKEVLVETPIYHPVRFDGLLNH